MLKTLQLRAIPNFHVQPQQPSRLHQILIIHQLLLKQQKGQVERHPLVQQQLEKPLKRVPQIQKVQPPHLILLRQLCHLTGLAEVDVKIIVKISIAIVTSNAGNTTTVAMTTKNCVLRVKIAVILSGTGIWSVLVIMNAWITRIVVMTMTNIVVAQLHRQ